MTEFKNFQPECSTVLNRPSRFVYQKHILTGLKETALKKFSQIKTSVALNEIQIIKSIIEYDVVLTAPLHGFKGIDDYYSQCSTQSKLINIKTPTLLIHSSDDPFMTEQSIPRKKQLSSDIELRLSSRGGHVGFVSSNRSSVGYGYWLEESILAI